jgi:plastocyanin
MRIRLSAVAALPVLLACGGDVAEPHQPLTGDGAAALYWRLTLDHEAVVLSTAAPYDTIRITATPRDARGAPLEGLGPVVYRTEDPEQVVVDPTGLVQARAAGSSLYVVAELEAGGVRHADTLFVTITADAEPPALAGLSIRPPEPDSVRHAVRGDGSFVTVDGAGRLAVAIDLKFVLSYGRDAAGNLIPGIPAKFQSSDTTVLQAFDGGTLVLLRGKRPGRAKVIASTAAYGVPLADTVEFEVIQPVLSAVRAYRRPSDGRILFGPEEVRVSPGGTVLWVNTSGDPVDVTFADPSGVAEHGALGCAAGGVVDPGGAGDIPAFGVPPTQGDTLMVENCRSRRFPTPGVYEYHSPLTGATGRVVVGDGLDGA